jgi:hypothetical protein
LKFLKMPFCAECGTNLGTNPGKFCPECGTATGAEPQQPKANPAPVISPQSVLQPQNRTPNPKSNEYLPGTMGQGGNINKNLSSAFGLEQNRRGMQPTMLTQTRDALTTGVCCRCKLGIQGAKIHALNKEWHEDCFACMGCGEAFSKTGNQRVLEKEGQPWCEPCYDRKFGEVCKIHTRPLLPSDGEQRIHNNEG